MADRNFSPAVNEALSNAQYAESMLAPLLSIIADECMWPLDNPDAAREAQSRLIALTDSARQQSRKIAECLESIDRSSWL